MIKRFSLYGFLKNMQFFEPFFILYFLDMGLNYFQIGLLISFRAICINVMEIPSGAIADIYGRKNALILSLINYIISFTIFTFTSNIVLLLSAIFFFSIGEAFRTGTHKAIIFHWLKENNKTSKKTEVYGYTRSWSKKGSAVSVLISAAIVISSNSYRWIFIFSIIPYLLGIYNIYSYPSYLNFKNNSDDKNIKFILIHLFNSIKIIFKRNNLKRLIIYSTGFEGTFNVAKEFFQPILKSQAILIAPLLLLEEKKSIAITIAIAYFTLNILSSISSKNAHRVENYFSTKKNMFIFLLVSALSILALSSIGINYNIYIIAILGFVALYILQNIWRPFIVAQYDDLADADKQATILSIESQSKSLGILILAPATGFLADNFNISYALLFLAFVILLILVYSFSHKLNNSS